MPVRPDLRDRLLALRDHDLVVRDRLAADGSLFAGYHPEMQAVHEANAAELQGIVDAHGWPTAPLVGKDGADAAWLIAQHAIGLPAFQRACLEAVRETGAPPWQAAYLDDRIRVLEGRPQLYGTQFDWDADGRLSPEPIEDPDNVDARRAAVGLPPLAGAVEKQRRAGADEPVPADLEARRRETEAWARSVGWRD
jgi:hypothetical protein